VQFKSNTLSAHETMSNKLLEFLESSRLLETLPNSFTLR